MFFLAEAWGWSPEDVLRLPVARRRRAVAWKNAAEAVITRKVENGGSGNFLEHDIVGIWGRGVLESSEDDY